MKSGVLKFGEEISVLEAVFDAAKMGEVPGINWVRFEEQVKSVVEHYLELKDAEGSEGQTKRQWNPSTQTFCSPSGLN